MNFSDFQKTEKFGCKDKEREKEAGRGSGKARWEIQRDAGHDTEEWDCHTDAQDAVGTVPTAPQ